MFKKNVVMMTSAILLTVVTLSFSQERMQTKPVPQQVPADRIQQKPPTQPGTVAPGKVDTKGLCPKPAFVTSSPLLQPASGGTTSANCRPRVGTLQSILEPTSWILPPTRNQ